jgi:O-antigen/teichoic acid export membrane protein
VIVLERVRRLALGRGAASNMARVVVLRSLALGGNVLTGLLTAALLGPAGRGEQTALLVMPMFLAAVSPFGLHASLIYNIKADTARQDSYLGAAMVLVAGAGVLAAGIGWLAAPMWLRRYDPDLIAHARLLLLFVPLMVLAPLLTGGLEAHSEFGTANRTIYVQSLATLVMLGLFWLLGELTPSEAALAYMVPMVPAMVYLWFKLRVLMRPSLRQFRAVSRALVHYGLRFCGVDILGTVATYMDQLVVVTLLAPGLVGNYAVALSLSRVLNVLQGAVTTVLFPLVAARPRTEVVDTVAVTVRLSLPVSILAALALGIIAPPLIVRLYGSGFASAIVPFQILLIEAVVSNTARILYQVYSGTGRPGVVTMIESVTAAVSVVALLVIVPRYGLPGAALALVLAACVRLICALGGIPLILRMRLPRLLTRRADFLLVTK